MDINEKLNLLNFAQRKAASAESSKDVAAAQGYAQALCHAKIITTEKMKELQKSAEMVYQQRLAEKMALRKIK